MRAMRCTLRTFVAVVSLVTTLSGCTYANEQLNPPTTALENRVRNHTLAVMSAEPARLASGQDLPLQPTTGAAPHDRNNDGWFVGLAISGGGSRSAVFSAAVMFELQRLGLLERVDYVSSVSGGSLTAAYYCSSGDDLWNPGTAQRKLTHSFASDVLIQAILTYPVLAFSDLDRSDLLANSLR